MGSAYEDLLRFPAKARREAGFQLGKLQAGQEPDHWKTLCSVGAGVCEIRIKEVTGIYRVMYVAKFNEAIYVLHCFQKKSEATAKHDKEITETRHRAVIQNRKNQP